MAYKRNKKRRYSKATKRALNVRGGFRKNWGVGGILKQVGMAAANSATQQAYRAAARSYKGSNVQLRMQKAAEDLNRQAKNLSSGALFDVGDGYQVIKAEKPWGKNIPGGETVGAYIHNAVRNVSPTGVVNSSKVYTSKFICGTKKSSTMRTTKAINGSTARTLRDTMIDSQTGTSRTGLLQSTGFNMRKFFAPDEAGFVTFQDISDLFDLTMTGRDISQTEYQNVYGLVASAGQSYKVHNSGSYYPVKVKVHFVAWEQAGVTPMALFQNTFNTTASVQEELALPIRYQYSNYGAVGHFEFVDLSRRGGGIFSAPSFKDRGKIVKTFSKRLAPGDTWNIHNLYNFGNGINLSALYGSMHSVNISSSTAFTYYPIFEIEGVMCEAIKNNDPAETFIGTSPSWVSIEMSKKVEFLNASRDITDWQSAGVTDEAAIKVYTRGDTIVQEKMIPLSLISTAATHYSIPTLTDKFVADAEQRT